MKKLDGDKFRKSYTMEFTRVFSKNDLKNERKKLADRIDEIDDLLDEMDKDK
jgi:hypothetical protein